MTKLMIDLNTLETWDLWLEALPWNSKKVFDTLNLLKTNGYVVHQQVQYSTILRSAQTVFMCFVLISEQTATSAPYNMN